MDWSEKVVLITGASSGIGRAFGIELARRGAAVGLLARRAGALDEIVREIEKAGGRAIALPADVTDADAVRFAACALRRKFGYIDTLIANAGVGATTYAVDLCEKEVAELIKVNVIGVANSVTAAVSALFESLRIDLMGTGVDVTILHPGFIKTPLTEGRKRMPYLMELDEAISKMVHAIEKRKKSYAFPWQLASIVRACMLLPIPLYDWVAAKNSFRE